MPRKSVLESIAEPKPLVAAIAAVVALGCLAPVAAAQGSRRFATPNEEGTAYTIDYAALARADDLTNAQKYQVARALRNGEGHVAAAGVESIDGFSGSCKIKKVLGIPDGGDCTLDADAAATKELASLDGVELTAAICIVLDSVDGELTEPFCELAVEALVSGTLERLIDGCAAAGEATELSIDFQLVPPGIKGDGKCE